MEKGKCFKHSRSVVEVGGSRLLETEAEMWKKRGYGFVKEVSEDFEHFYAFLHSSLLLFLQAYILVFFRDARASFLL